MNIRLLSSFARFCQNENKATAVLLQVLYLVVGGGNSALLVRK